MLTVTLIIAKNVKDYVVFTFDLDNINVLVKCNKSYPSKTISNNYQEQLKNPELFYISMRFVPEQLKRVDVFRRQCQQSSDIRVSVCVM